MNRKIVLLPLLVLALSAVPVDAAPSPQQTNTVQTQQSISINPDLMGMVIRDPWYDFGTNPAFPGAANQSFQDSMGAHLAQMGVRWVRLDFQIPLSYNDTSEANALYEIAKNDYFITTVAPRYNLNILALLNFSLVQNDARDLNCETATCLVSSSKYGGGVNTYMEAWLSRALMIADRYGSKIAAYEVLNEQNRLAIDSSAIKPNITARITTKFYRFCKNIGATDKPHGCTSGTQIILGGLHPRGTGTGKTPNPTDVGYLQQVYADSAFADFKALYGHYPVDGIGYHPYPEEIRLSSQDVYVNQGITRMRMMLNNYDPGQQFWVTEVGYNVGFDPDGAKNPRPAQTESGQMAFMRDVYQSLAQRSLNNGQAEVAHIFWFKYEDFPPATGINAQRWGLVRIPFTTGNCPGGACYDVNGTPNLYRGSLLVYRELAGLTNKHIFLPLLSR